MAVDPNKENVGQSGNLGMRPRLKDEERYAIGEGHVTIAVYRGEPVSNVARIKKSIPVCILQIIRDAVSIRVQRITVCIRGHVVITDIHDGIGLGNLGGLGGEMVEAHLVRRGAADIDKR